MPRIRSIKPEFWTDEKLSPLPPIDRLVFLGLISMADDAGRLVDNVRLLDGLLFPSTTETCAASIETLVRLSRVSRYTSGSGQHLLQINNWGKHQRVEHPSAYTLPGPPDQDCEPQHLTTPPPDPQETLLRLSGDSHAPILDQRSTINDQEQEKEYGASEQKPNGYPPEFEAAWRLYPRREGGNPKKAALKAWAARVREGIPPGDLLEATRRYRAYCDAKLTTGSPYVMQGETFYGPHERWAEKFQADGLGDANRKLLRSASKLDGLDLGESFR